MAALTLSIVRVVVTSTHGQKETEILYDSSLQIYVLLWFLLFPRTSSQQDVNKITSSCKKKYKLLMNVKENPCCKIAIMEDK